MPVAQREHAVSPEAVQILRSACRTDDAAFGLHFDVAETAELHQVREARIHIVLVALDNRLDPLLYRPVLSLIPHPSSLIPDLLRLLECLGHDPGRYRQHTDQL